MTDDVAAKSMLIYEDDGKTKLTSTKIKNLSKNTSVSSYLNDQIIALDNIVSKSDTGLAVIGMASDTSNSVTSACNGIEIVSSKEKSGNETPEITGG